MQPVALSVSTSDKSVVWSFALFDGSTGELLQDNSNLTASFAAALTVFLVLYFVLSAWLALGFMTNHLGCEVFNLQESQKLSWMELQMRTSRSLKGGVFTHWFYGGLNTQIEHHLFPNAPRFNLLAVQQLTREFAKKHDIKYFEATPVEAYRQINHALKSY